jgi:hypothetical protein
VIKDKKKSFKKYYNDSDNEDEINIKESYKRVKINPRDIPLIIEEENECESE